MSSATRAALRAGLAFDVKNHILFVACRKPANMVMLNSDDGKIIAALPLGTGTDGAVFNPATMEAFSSQGDGTLTVIKENSPDQFRAWNRPCRRRSRQDADPGQQDQPHPVDHRRIRSSSRPDDAASGRWTRRPRRPRRDGAGFVLHRGGGQVIRGSNLAL